MMPHGWDDDAHRLAILSAFDVLQLCLHQRNLVQARRWMMTLRDLTDAAKVRARTVAIEQACAELGLQVPTV